MRKNFTSAFFLLLIFVSLTSSAQNPATELTENDAAHPCITRQEYAMIEKQCAENRQLLGLNAGAQRGTMTTSLSWPLRPAAGLHDCNYYYISAHVDHNAAVNTVTDYHCGSLTYDGHGGTDISIWPYNFYKMDNDLVEVVAAAPGTILYKSDGHFDKNCAANSDTANYIIIQHADGSQANYWHMKKNSLTAKTVGQTVVAGEFLGIVGSSGSSTGPHLHFEVWSGSTSATRIDPFAGTCNMLNANSWWTSQLSYAETAVVKASVNTTDIVIPACPGTETPNESSSFEIPFQGAGLPAGYAKFYIFIDYDSTGKTVDLSILNPDATTFNSWVYTSTANNKVHTQGWSKLLPTTPGTYTFKAVFKGIECAQSFDIFDPLFISQQAHLSAIKVYPNPATDVLNISENELENGNYHFTLKNVMGQSLSEQNIKIENNSLQEILPVSQLTNGLYFLVIEKENMRTVVKVNKLNQ